MKKGFTLVELIAIFALISAMILVSVPAVSNMLKKSKDSRYESFKNSIFLACEAYIEVNHADFYELKEVGAQAYISISDLISSNYIKSTLKDPYTGKKISEEKYYTVVVTVLENKTFNYELKEETLYHSYHIGDIFYYDPGDYKVKQFYVIENSDSTNPLLTLILSKNITSNITFENHSTELANKTAKWTNVTSDQIRDITKEEVEKVMEIDNTLLADDSGYWTSTENSGKAWIVKDKLTEVNKTAKYGIRPVIRIKKYK